MRYYIELITSKRTWYFNFLDQTYQEKLTNNSYTTDYNNALRVASIRGGRVVVRV